MFFDFIEIELGGDQYKSRSFHSISSKIAYDSTVKMDKNETLNYQIMQKNQPIFNGTIEWSANLYEYISAQHARTGQSVVAIVDVTACLLCAGFHLIWPCLFRSVAWELSARNFYS